MSKKTHNAEYTKQYNRRWILKLLSRGNLSRADLSRATGLTRAAVTVIVDEMIREGVILESEAVAVKRGRSPVPLCLNENAFYAAGIYLNRKVCRVGIVSAGGRCLEEVSLSFEREDSAGERLDRMASVIRGLLRDRPEETSRMLGIGISGPGPMDVKSGAFLEPPDFGQWHHVKICGELEERTGFSTWLCDNADALALYNMQFGPMRDCENFLLLLVDSGIGSGVVTEGRIYRGKNGMSAELGHASIACGGKPCVCGSSGCLEAYASIPHILEGSSYEKKSWGDVMAEAARGEREAICLLERETEYLSCGVANAVNLFDLNTVVLAGDVLEGYESFGELLREKTERKVLYPQRQQIRIVPGDVREYYDVVSAANIVFQKRLF